MLRRLCRFSFFQFAINNAKKYSIKSRAFLVEEKPQKPVASYIKFYQDQTLNIDHSKIDIQFQRKLRQKWQDTPDLKKKYDDQFNALQQQYLKKTKFWEQNFEVPFKKLSFMTQFVKKIHQENLVHTTGKIGQLGKKTGELMKMITNEERQEIDKEVQRIKAQRQQAQLPHKFPVRLYDTQKAYDMKNIQPKAKHTEALKKKMQAEYEAYVQQWMIEVENWLKANNITLTIDEFVKMYEQCIAKKPKKKEPTKSEETKKQQAPVETKPVPPSEPINPPVPTSEPINPPVPASKPINPPVPASKPINPPV